MTTPIDKSQEEKDHEAFWEVDYNSSSGDINKMVYFNRGLLHARQESRAEIEELKKDLGFIQYILEGETYEAIGKAMEDWYSEIKLKHGLK